MIFNMIGSILIATTVISLSTKKYKENDLLELENQLDDEVSTNTIITIFGIICLVVGFVLTIIGEVDNIRK